MAAVRKVSREPFTHTQLCQKLSRKQRSPSINDRSTRSKATKPRTESTSYTSRGPAPALLPFSPFFLFPFPFFLFPSSFSLFPFPSFPFSCIPFCVLFSFPDEIYLLRRYSYVPAF